MDVNVIDNDQLVLVLGDLRDKHLQTSTTASEFVEDMKDLQSKLPPLEIGQYTFKYLLNFFHH
jgi:hypothetical protein